MKNLSFLIAFIAMAIIVTGRSNSEIMKDIEVYTTFDEDTIFVMSEYWQELELATSDAKIFRNFPFPWWIPISGSVITAGGLTTWWLTKDQSDTGDTALEISSDHFRVACHSQGTLDVLKNDSGDGIHISSVTGASAMIPLVNIGSSIQVADVGTSDFSFEYSISDVYGKTASTFVNVEVYDETAPNINCPPDITLQCGEEYGPEYTGMADANDNCTEVAFISLEYLDDISQLNGTGMIQRTWQAVDMDGNSSFCTQLIHVVDEKAPEITCPASISLSCEDKLETQLTGFAEAIDNCSLPEEIQINFTDDNSGLSGCNGTGVLIRTFIASDGSGNTSSCSQEIIITDEIPPVMECPPDVVLGSYEEATPENIGFATVNDNCSDTDIELSYTDDLSKFDGVEGVILRNWIAKDACGMTNSCEQVIIVESSPCNFPISFEQNDPDCGLENGSIKAVYDQIYDVSFEWSNGATDPDIVDLGAGEYHLNITESQLHCTLGVDFQLFNKQVDYQPTFFIDSPPCPGNAIVYLNLISMGEGIFTIHISGPGIEETMSGIEGEYIALHDYWLMEQGEYNFLIYEESRGEECSQELTLTLEALASNSLFLIELIPPTNADQNNGSAIFSIDQTILQAPFNISLNGIFYKAIWEPEFIIDNLGFGEYSVELIDANGCISDPVFFTLFGTGFQPDKLLFSLNHTYPSSTLSTWNEGMSEDIGRYYNKEKIISEGEVENTALLFQMNSNLACINWEKSISNVLFTKTSFKGARVNEMLILQDDLGKEPILIPLNILAGEISFSGGTVWNFPQIDMRLTFGAAYNMLRLDESSFDILMDQTGIEALGQSMESISFDLSASGRFKLSEHIYISAMMGSDFIALSDNKNSYYKKLSKKFYKPNWYTSISTQIELNLKR